MAAKKKSSAAQFRMAEERLKKKPIRADVRGRTGMGASYSRKPKQTVQEKAMWVTMPGVMAANSLLKKAMYGSNYIGDPGEKPSPRKNKKKK